MMSSIAISDDDACCVVSAENVVLTGCVWDACVGCFSFRSPNGEHEKRILHDIISMFVYLSCFHEPCIQEGNLPLFAFAVYYFVVDVGRLFTVILPAIAFCYSYISDFTSGEISVNICILYLTIKPH